MDLSDEHSIVDLKNRVEASVVIWQKKMTHKDSKLSWGHNARHEKRGMFEGRAENVLLLIKHRFPGIAQSALDISKIQCNKVGGSEEEAFRVPLLFFFQTRHIASLTNALHHAYLPSTMHLLFFVRMLALPFWRATPGLWRAWPSRSCLGSKMFSARTWPLETTPRTQQGR